MISKPWNGNGEYNYWISYNSNKTIQIQLRGDHAWSTNTSQKLSTDSWQHIAVSIIQDSEDIQDSKEVSIYLNGKLVKNLVHDIDNWTPAHGDLNRPLTIATLYPYGCSWEGNTWHAFDGLIDEVRIYEEALTSTQIQKIYAEGLEKHQNLASR